MVGGVCERERRNEGVGLGLHLRRFGSSPARGSLFNDGLEGRHVEHVSDERSK